MPAYEGSRETIVRSTPGEAFAVLTDYETLAEWQRALTRCEVLDRYDDGLGREVHYEVDAKVRRVEYTLRHSYDPPREISSEYLDGDFRCLEGRWTLIADAPQGTRARLETRIDPGRRVPGPIRKMLSERVLKSAVEDLRNRLERG